MGPGILIALLAASIAAIPAPADTLAAGSLPDSVARTAAGRDTARPARVRHPLPPSLRDRSPAWGLPVRSGSAGGALDQAFREGASAVPWRSNFEFDGMYESWTPWCGLPLEERASRLAWDGPSLAGAGDAGPLAGSAVQAFATAGPGGAARREILPDPAPSDTPSTALHFYRGALASYRFGLDFSRAVWGPWGFRLSTETRSAQTRAWMYRDQIQDLFQGSFGRSRQDLPAQGRSPGQDDQQWEAALVRGDSTSRMDLGWTWVDLRRGVPDPAHRWNGPDLSALPASQGRSGWFGRWTSQEGAWSIRTDLRTAQDQWNWWGWSDSGAPVAVSGDLMREDGSISLRRGDSTAGAGVRARGRVVSGTRAVPGLGTDVDEDLERAALFADGRKGMLSWEVSGGWTRLSGSDDRLETQPDWAAQATWGDSSRISLSISRQATLPDEESQRPDPLLRTAPAEGLPSQIQDLLEVRSRLQLSRAWWLEGSGAFLSRRHSIQPLAVPRGTDSAGRIGAFRLADAGTTAGWSGEAGVGWADDPWRVRTLWSLGWTGLPDGGLSRRDPRIPCWQSRSTAGWRRDFLDGRLKARLDLDLRMWGESWAWTSAATDTFARAERLPAASQLDLETQVAIRTFVIVWRIENILDSRQIPAVGWTPPGIRAGWGITWNFGG